MKKKWLEGIRPVPLSLLPRGGKILKLYIIEAGIIEHRDGDILELDVYKEEIHGGPEKKKNRKLMCRHFLIKNKEYATYFPEKKRLACETYEKGWSNAQLETVLSGCGSKYYCYASTKDIYISPKACTVIKSYLDGGIENTWRMIVQEEYSISRKRVERAEENKKNRIKKLMKSIAPMDGQFDQWARKLLPEEYLFADNHKTKLGYHCRCSACEKGYYEKIKPKHNEITTCRKCRQQITVKTRTHNIDINKNIMVLQEYEGKTMIRQFKLNKCSMVWNKRAGSVYNIQENIRMFLEKNKKTKIYYKNGSKRLDGCGWTDRKGGMTIASWSYMYPVGIEECTLEKGIKTALMQAAAAGKLMMYNQIIRLDYMHKYLEYMIKGRLYRLASETAHIWSVPEWSVPDCMDEKSDNIQGMLKLDKQRVLRLREMDGGMDALEALQWEMENKEKISQENLCYINAGKIDIYDIEKEMKRTGLSFNRMINYIRRQQEKEKESVGKILEMYKDYLDMAKRKNANLHDDIIRVNPRLKEFHDLYAEELQREKDEKRVLEVDTKFAGIEKDYQRNCRLFAWENAQYAIMVPQNAGQIIEEGRAQHHCVGASDTYMEKMHKRETYILFLRDKKQQETPWYTLEITEELQIRQKYAAYDRQPDIGLVNKILSEWKKEIQTRRKKKSEETEGACIRAAV